jgi:Cu(I)/Ag(I) efflux system membrane fusion protein
MNNKIVTVILIIIALAVGIYIGPRISGLAPTGSAGGDASSGEKEILYWVAPMDPNYRRDEPGKSPMGMDLVPVYADDQLSGDVITISPAVENNLGVRTAPATIRPLWRRIEATGYVGFDEKRISHINLRTKGWITRLLVDAQGERVKKNDLLFEFYSPELVNAQKEYLQARKRSDSRLKAGSTEKLLALGMNRSGIEALARRGKSSDNIRVVAPQDGIITVLNIREGMYVQPNTTIMSLADLSSVWLQAEIFESQAEWVAAGQAAEARLDYMPGEVFTGQVDYVYPVLDPKTRTLRARLLFENPGERLKPNMYARVSIYGKLHPNALSIPRDALIRAPDRDRVVVALGDGKFRVFEVMTGMDSGEFVEILAGIEEGDEVVTSAQFLLDSEASLTGSIQRLDSEPILHDERRARTVFASGRIEAVDAAKNRIRISHGPIDDLGWPSMTMEFDTLPGVDLSNVSAGQEVRFQLKQEHAGEYAIASLALSSADNGELIEQTEPGRKAEADGEEHDHD